MNKTIRATVLRLGLALGLGMIALGGGCASVSSTMPSMTNVTGEAWYTEGTGFFGMQWGSRIWYCPAATSPGPTTCVEAKLVELTKEELKAQEPKK